MLHTLEQIMIKPIRCTLHQPYNVHALSLLAQVGLPTLRTYRAYLQAKLSKRIRTLPNTHIIHHINKQQYRINKRLIHRTQPIGVELRDNDRTLHSNTDTYIQPSDNKQIKQALHNKQDKEWRHAATKNKDSYGAYMYNTLQQHTAHTMCSYLKHDNKQTSILRSRMRLRRTYLAAHRHRLYNTHNKPIDIECTLCNSHAVQDNIHILLYCTRFDRQRHKLQCQLDYLYEHTRTHTPIPQLNEPLILGSSHTNTYSLTHKLHKRILAYTGFFLQYIGKHIQL